MQKKKGGKKTPERENGKDCLAHTETDPSILVSTTHPIYPHLCLTVEPLLVMQRLKKLAVLLVTHSSSSLEEEYVTDQEKRNLGAVRFSHAKRGEINCSQIRVGARRRLTFQTDASYKEKRHGSFFVATQTSDNSEFLHMLRFMLMFDAYIMLYYSQPVFVTIIPALL